MKKIKFIPSVLCATLLFLGSCNSNETPSSNSLNEKLAVEQNASEDNKISVANLEKGVLINGATKKTGNPPTPTNNLDLQINTDKKEAFQISGFKIKFSSNDNIAGAYIRFKNTDGKSTPSYFNVPINSFASRSISSRTNERTINVNFTKAVPPGKFCYDICLYDNQNNISTIKTVCITVEAWGGNANLVGAWKLENFQEAFTSSSLTCGNGKDLKVVDTNVIDSNIVINLNADGSYNDSLKDTTAKLNFEETKKSCSPVYGASKERSQKRTGNWSFNEDDNTLTIFVFSLQDLLNSTNNQKYDFGSEFFTGIKLTKVAKDSMILEEGLGSGRILRYRFTRV